MLGSQFTFYFWRSRYTWFTTWFTVRVILGTVQARLLPAEESFQPPIVEPHPKQLKFNPEEVYELPFKMIRENKLRRFHFKSIQSLIRANQLLSKMKIKDRPYCEPCRSSEETTPHLFVQCNEVKASWKLAIDWWNEKRTENLHPDQKEIVYGYKPNSTRFHAFNHYFLIAEHQFIWSAWSQSHRIWISSSPFCGTKLKSKKK